ncbi:hypothetical protein VNO77_25992 [Canavalia gladiata]|uniref:Uncharacterized protein n=1 Tax=Canavalia gladiata TaxID=3824 RepID=A0AAN9KSG3_CANGL
MPHNNDQILVFLYRVIVLGRAECTAKDQQRGTTMRIQGTKDQLFGRILGERDVGCILTMGASLGDEAKLAKIAFASSETNG